ncbi:MAG: 4Fe-4S binding protein [Desulfobacteraceae bacterium]|jgi:NAD-dependent dihydropyrimidine dehydrogenase PreA subunit|nr:4Fe-4S binding protein [Desulfobacteraceae bacterium]
MPSEIYKKLQEQLDQYSCGYPTTDSGVEFKILERLFTEEESEMFLSLSQMAETPEEVAQRLGRDPEVVATLLDQMADKGTVFRLRKGKTNRYGAVPFMLGFYEFQLGSMDSELSGLFEQYFEEAFLDSMGTVDPLMRTIPVHRTVEALHPVATFEDSREIVKKQQFIAVANCICRVQQGLLDKSCGKPVEVCLLFGSWGQHYIDLGIARQITVEETLNILDQAEEAGLVTQPSNSLKPSAICNCCGDCCAILRSLNKLSRPAEAVTSNCFCVVNTDLCDGCETCLDRCQMGAIAINEDGVAQINMDRCIGCGLCVTKCPSEALHLEVKPENQRRQPPETAREVVKMMAQKRGKSLTPLALKATSP